MLVSAGAWCWLSAVPPPRVSRQRWRVTGWGTPWADGWLCGAWCSFGMNLGLFCGSPYGLRGSTPPLHPPCSSWSYVCNLGVSSGGALGCPRSGQVATPRSPALRGALWMLPAWVSAAFYVFHSIPGFQNSIYTVSPRNEL